MGKANQTRSDKVREKLSIEQRRLLVEVNLVAGASQREIARQLEVSLGTVNRDVSAIFDAYKAHYTDMHQNFLTVQQRRYDVLLNSVWNLAKDGNLAQLDRALLIMDKQNALMGIGQRLRGDDWEQLAIQDIRAGMITYDALAETFGDADLATRLFTAAGVPLSLGAGTGKKP